MIASHLLLGFVTAYIGYTPHSMLNITASKIYIENDKKIARQFIVGASVIVLLQVFLAVKISEFLEEYPQLIEWVQNFAIVIFSILSTLFIYKGISKNRNHNCKTN